jgi:choline dehydrogenase
LPNSHWVGSAKMGKDDDPMAVVNDKLQVRGVAGLRVVDASIMPNIPNGNTHSTVCVIASMAADIIFEDRTEKKANSEQRTLKTNHWFTHA